MLGKVRFDNSKNLFIVLLILLVFFFVALYLYAIGPYWEITPDSATYVSAARSLAKGQGYKELGKSVSVVPPLTSLIFSGFIFIWSDNYFVLNFVVVIFTLLSLYLSFILFRDLGTTKSLIIMLLSLSSIFLFEQITFLLSDIFYMFFSIFSLVLIRNIENLSFFKIKYFLLGITILFACLTRIAGLALALAIIIYSLYYLSGEKLRLKYILIIIASIAILSVIIYEVRSMRLGESYARLFFEKQEWVKESGYISFVDLIKRFLFNAYRYKNIGLILSNGIFANFLRISNLFQLATFILLFLGLYAAFRKKTNVVVAIYIIIYLLGIISVPGDCGTRFFMPILPILFYFVVLGMEFILKKSLKFLNPIYFKAIYAAFLIYIIFYSWQGASYILKEIPGKHKSPFGAYPIKYSSNYDIQELAMWLRDHTAKEATYIDQHPHMMDIITERKGYSFPFSSDQNKLLYLLKTKGITYILVDKTKLEVRQFLLPVIKTYSEKFSLIKDNNMASLYEYKYRNASH